MTRVLLRKVGATGAAMLLSGMAAISLGLVTVAGVPAERVDAQAASRFAEMEPGVYRVRPVRATRSYCLGRGSGSAGELALTPCNSFVAFAVVPTRSPRTFTVRPTQSSTPVGPWGDFPTTCVTLARAVIFGAKRIDSTQCQTRENATSRGDAGAMDQGFLFRQTGPASFMLQVRDDDDQPHCWDMRGLQEWDGGGDVHVFKEPCGSSPYQEFTFERLEDLGRWPELQGWAEGRLGRTLAAAVTAPTEMLNGYNLPGSDYASFPTYDDGGRNCIERCRLSTRCRAISWVRAGAYGNQSPMCWMKDAVPGRAADANVNSAVVRQ